MEGMTYKEHDSARRLEDMHYVMSLSAWTLMCTRCIKRTEDEMHDMVYSIMKVKVPAADTSFRLSIG